MNINIGSGYKKPDGYIHVDADPSTNPDHVVNLEKDKLPFDNNSVDNVQAHHILEHLGEGYFHCLQELYRVCKDGALIDIVVPHHRHDFFLNDPTHRRPITVSGLQLFSKKFNKECIINNDGSSKLGMLYDVDFEVVHFEYAFDPITKPLFEPPMTPEKESQIQFAVHTQNNIVMETHVVLSVCKQ